jgi:flagellar basal body rod protein FlgB
MSIFQSRMLSQLKENLRFLRESQKVTANNIARANSPGAEPLKLERTSFKSMLDLAQPNSGQGFMANHRVLSQYTALVDIENRTEAVPGKSRISIENESIRMAELDDQHMLMLGLKKGWTRAIRSITGSQG